MNEQQLLGVIIRYFREEIFERHLAALEDRYTSLQSYDPNLFLLPYLSKILEDEVNPSGVAKALYFARTLATSINTSFGHHIKKILVDNDLAQPYGSTRSNLVVFTDRTDQRLTGCLLKSGPYTINSGDKSGIIDKLNGCQGVDRKVVGVIYGHSDNLNAHYIQLREANGIPVYTGQEFWYRVTGFSDFYDNLIIQLTDLARTLQTQGRFQIGLESLTQQTGQSPIFNFFNL